jgi:hypothetical protein
LRCKGGTETPQATRRDHPRRLGNAHERRRSAIAPIVHAGKATCARCNEPIHPDDDWHLDHNDTRDGYLGVSHATCNLRDGANKTNGKRPPTPPEQPYRWSQRWSDDPPIGTIVLGHERVIYLGNGEWQPFADTPNR